MKKVFATDMLNQHVAVLGKTGSGKSCTIKLMVEQILGVDPTARICIIDPIKSDYWGLTSSASGKEAGLAFDILGGPHGHVPLHPSAGKVVGELVATGALPLSIIDMADFGPGDAQDFFNDFAPALFKNIKGVIHLVIDEAHEFAPKERVGFAKENMAVYWAKRLATASRSKGIRLILATQATQQLHNRLLGSCDTLIALRMTAPADQEPVLKWLKANASKTVYAEVSDGLSKLKTGTGFICSGEANLAARIEFPMIQTFDNSATPDSRTAARKVKTATVDQDKLRALIGAAVEKAEADDPAKLRAKIVDLERKLSAAGAAVQVDPVALDAARREGYLEGWQMGTSEGFDQARGHAQTLLKGLQEATGKALDTSAQVVFLATKPPAVPVKIRPISAESDRIRPNPANQGNHGTDAAVPWPSVYGQELSRPQQNILDALAWLHSVGVYEVDKPRIAMLADQSVKSSGFRANLSTLSAGGFINRLGDKVSLSEIGQIVAQKPYRHLTSKTLQDAIKSKVSGPQRAMLDAAINVHPHAIAKDELANRSGQSPTSSGFRANLSTLSSLGFLKRQRDSDSVMASSILFVKS